MASFYSRLSGEGDMLPTSYMLTDNVYESQPSVSFSYPNFEAESQSNTGSRDEMLFIPPTSGPTGLHQINTPRYSDGNSVISEPIPQYHGLSLSLGSQAQSLVNMPSDLNHYTNSSSFCSMLSSDMQSELDLSQNKNVQYLSFDLVGKTQNNFQDLISSKETSFTQSLNLCNSKYLKAAQDLLDEVVNVHEALKPSEKRQNLNSIGQDVKRDGVSENHEFTLHASHDLTTFERHNLQNKVTKLLSMLDEVDRRYKQYLNQMQLVVSSFDMVAGRGSARPYTTLALQTISRQFRCLRDAIRKHIQSTQISLGEQDSNLHGQGVLSRLRFVDQQLRQQKAMQQFGIMRQPWRPQRGLPDTAVSVLRAWLFEHFLHPYPKDSEKIVLARQTGLSRGQVANWFINARVRLWKPMIEDMYKEEFGDAESAEHKFSPEQDCTNTMGSQVSLNLGLQHTENDSQAIDCETRPKGKESLDKLEYYYVDPMNNQHSQDFPIKNLGGLHYFLGLECNRNSAGLFISQRKYILDLLQKTNMANCKPVSSPMASSTRLSAFDSPSFEDPSLYRSVVGSLQYLLFTRPDIAFSVNRVCQYMHAPCISHWQSVKRILRYLKSTTDFGLYLRPSTNPSLAAYTDADWAGSPDDRKSTGGFCIYYGQNLVSWSSKKQHTIARSSTEAEYKALALATCELLWIQSLMTELGVSLSTAPILYCDNLGATYLSKNPIMHSRVKHVDIDYHFVRELIHNKALRVSFLSSKDQIADILTKPLSTPRFSLLRASLTVRSLPFGSRGHINNTSTQDNSPQPKSLQP